MNLLNGQPATSIDLLDRGVHYGDGLFETIAFDGREPLLWREHTARMREGCCRLDLPMPDLDLLRIEAIQANGDVPRGVVKIVITRGTGGRGYSPPQSPFPTRLVMGFPWPAHPRDYQSTGVAIRVCHTRLSRNPILAGMKHLNRLEQVLARAEWSDKTTAEGLMLDTAGELVEGTMSNLFLIEGGKLVTPDLKACGVAGVMRAQVMACAAALDISCEVTSLSLDRARAADGLFLTNSIIGLWPVRILEGQSYAITPLVRRLQQRLLQEHACV